jgi:peptidoglycan hydrolase-like protein with peptidoglycan-binding domain
MGTMYDSETPAAIPSDAEIVAGYVDGQWPDYDELVTLFPNARHVSITVSGMSTALVGDCEKGDMSPAGLAIWVKAEIGAGRRPTLYYSKDNAGAVSAALLAEGLALTAVDYWVADWTGEAHLLPGTVATQWASPGTGSGGNYDISETVEAWPPASVEPAPEPSPVPPPSPEPAPAPPPPPSGGFMPPTVKRGDLSASVKSAQALLNLHAPLSIDGDFGPATETAAENFQKVFELVVDGIVGPQTWTTLCTFG